MEDTEKEATEKNTVTEVLKENIVIAIIASVSTDMDLLDMGIVTIITTIIITKNEIDHLLVTCLTFPNPIMNK